MKHMWRDIQRRAARYALEVPAIVPVPGYPLASFDEANLVGVVANEDGFYWEYLKAAYRLWFIRSEPPGTDAAVRAALAELGKDADAIIARSKTEEVRRVYEANTAAAMEAGVFGAPSFSVGEELFWGDVRSAHTRVAVPSSPAEAPVSY